jgi:hypothetical protein
MPTTKADTMKKSLFTYSTLCGTGLLFACASPAPVSTLPVKAPLNAASQAERPDGYYQLGRFYQGQNRVDQAIDAYRKALALDRNFTDAHNALGALYAAQGRLDEAVAEFTIVVAALPMTSYAWNNLGYAYLLQGKSGDAVAALERATAFDLTNQRAWNNLGTALAQRGDSAAATEKFARAAELAAAASAASPAPARAASPAASSPAAPAVMAVTATPMNVGDRISPANFAEVSALSPAAPAVMAVTATPMNVGDRISPANFAEVSASSPAAPAVMAVTATPMNVGDRISPANFAEVSASSPAAPAVMAITAIPMNVGDHIPLGKFADVSAPIELGPQPSAFDSGKDTASFASAIVDNTGFSELVQLAPSVYELRLSPQSIALQTFRLELSNGNGVTGMARRLGEQLIAKGLPKARLTNQKPFRQRVTQIQYRDGYAEVAATLRSRMPNQPPMIKTAALRASTDVRVVLGRDLPRDVALLDAAPEVTQVAHASQDTGNGSE